MWKYLKHPNILPLLGVTIFPPQLISARMVGDLLGYVGDKPEADRLLLVGVPPFFFYREYSTFTLNNSYVMLRRVSTIYTLAEWFTEILKVYVIFLNLIPPLHPHGSRSTYLWTSLMISLMHILRI